MVDGVGEVARLQDGLASQCSSELVGDLAVGVADVAGDALGAVAADDGLSDGVALVVLDLGCECWGQLRVVNGRPGEVGQLAEPMGFGRS